MKFLSKFILFLIILLVVVPVLVLGYLGFIPQISSYFGSDKPRDLGVTFTEADRAAAYINNGVESVPITITPDNPRGLSYTGLKEVRTSFSSAEITALINSNRWVNYPISSIQIKINPDGTGEASGVLDIPKILFWVSFTHSVKEIETKIKEYHIGFNPPFYLKGSVSVTDNKVTLTPQMIQVGRLTIPQKIIADNIPAVSSFIETRLNAVPNLQIRSFNLNGGKVNFDATVPEKELSVQQ